MGERQPDIASLPRLYTRDEVMAYLHITSGRSFRRLLADVREVAPIRGKLFDLADIEKLREASRCPSTSRAAALGSGTRAGRSGRAVKASPSQSDPRDAVRALTRKLLRRDGIAPNETASSTVKRRRS